MLYKARIGVPNHEVINFHYCVWCGKGLFLWKMTFYLLAEHGQCKMCIIDTVYSTPTFRLKIFQTNNDFWFDENGPFLLPISIASSMLWACTWLPYAEKLKLLKKVPAPSSMKNDGTMPKLCLNGVSISNSNYHKWGGEEGAELRSCLAHIQNQLFV